MACAAPASGVDVTGGSDFRQGRQATAVFHGQNFMIAACYGNSPVSCAQRPLHEPQRLRSALGIAPLSAHESSLTYRDFPRISLQMSESPSEPHPSTAAHLKRALVEAGFEVFRTRGDEIVLAERPRENLIMDSGVQAVHSRAARSACSAEGSEGRLPQRRRCASLCPSSRARAALSCRAVSRRPGHRRPESRPRRPESNARCVLRNNVREGCD
jgi:hypothetical protein